MSELGHTSGNHHSPIQQGSSLHFGRGLLLWLALVFGCSSVATAQTLRLGPLDLEIIGDLELGYDSNVDDLTEDEVKPGYARGDAYWMPGLTLRSQPVPLRPNTTLNVLAGVAYQDYFQRHDLDTEVYNAAILFQTVHPRLTLGGGLLVDYSIDNAEHEYVPGGFTRDPTLTQEANAQISWKYRILRLEGKAKYIRERHDYVEYQYGDNNESTLTAQAFLDVWSWGSLYYEWERTTTLFIQSNEEIIETTQEFGLEGAIPFELLRRPKIRYSFGLETKTEITDSGEEVTSWEPVHTLSVEDEFTLSKSVTLYASALWENTVDDDEVTFQYNFTLKQQIGPRAEHTLSFTQEPRPTLGSNNDTETTTYAYNLRIKDILIHNLDFNFDASYDEDTPLGVPGALTEETTKLGWGLTHTRAFSRRLERVAAYQYTWEKSSFSKTGAKIKHLITYGLSYRF